MMYTKEYFGESRRVVNNNLFKAFLREIAVSAFVLISYDFPILIFHPTERIRNMIDDYTNQFSFLEIFGLYHY